MAFIQTRPVHPNFDLDTISRLVVPDENGCHFANLTILHCAACLRYCYGDGEKSVGTYQRLREAQDRWDAERPWIFRPMYYDEKNGIFPEVVFLNNAVVTGVLHHYLVEILLAAHNPKVPKLGPSHSKHLRKVDEEIKRNVLMVCGIAEVSCSSSFPSTDTFSELVWMQSNCRTVACYA